MSQWGWNPTADQQAAMMAAWNNAQSKLIEINLRKIIQLLWQALCKNIF